METFSPNTPEPPVPIPFGQLTVAVAESITTPHPIAITNPVLLSDFPDTPQGAVAYMALQRVSEFLTHGFYTPNNLSAPHRELWLHTVSQIMVHIHNSIRRTHVADPLPNAFLDMSSDETEAFSLLVRTLSSLSTFFDNRFENIVKPMDDSDPSVDSWEICLRCLEECQYPITKAQYESVLMSCSQNIHAAHRTIINDKLRSLTVKMDEWVDARRTQIQSAFIDAVTSKDFSFLFDATDHDLRLDAWVNSTVTNFTDHARKLLINDIIATEAQPILIERVTAAKVKAEREAEEYLATFIRDECAKAKATAIQDASQFYNNTLSSLKAEALEKAEREVAAYKSNLKVASEERKASLLANFERRAPKLSTPSIPSSSSRSAKRKARLESTNPISCPSPALSISRSRSRSCAPSPESHAQGRSPDMQTPCASPAVELPPTRALTEPALELQPPPTNVSVGPPSNSFKSAMMHVDTTNMQTFEYPACELSAPPIDTLPATSSRSSTDPPTSTIEALIRSLSSQLSLITSRLDRLEQPKTYSPSAPAALWAPPRSSKPKPGQPGYSARDEPTEGYQDYENLDALPSSADAPGDYFHDIQQAQFQSDTQPEWPDAYLTELYRTHLGLSADQDLIGSQNEFALSLPGIFILFCNHAHISPDHPLSQFEEPAFWNFVTEYTASSDAALLSLQPSNQPEPERPAPAAWTSGSIQLFPPRTPSQPPAPPVCPTAASAVPQGTSAGFPFRAVPPGAVGPAGPAPVAPPPPPSTAPWSVMGKGNKPRSFAAAAAPRRSAPVVLSPIQAVLRPGDLSLTQMQNLSRDQLMTAYESRFRVRVTSRTASKLSLQMAYKRGLETEAALSAAPSKPSKPANQRPKPRPVNTTEFTVTCDPSTVAIRGPQGDASAIICSLQTSIRQAFPGVNPPIHLLGGHWSSSLSSNFVLTFSGTPSNDDIKRYSAVLCSPFGPGATILPQRGYTRISINFVPIVLDADGNRPSSDTLANEINSNATFNGVTCVSPPKWLHATFTDGQTHSLVVLSFLDPDGSHLRRITKNPVFMFGAACEAKLFNSLPIIRQCDRCHHLGHSTECCRLPPTVTVCALCGGRHAACNHPAFCKTRSNHTNLDCNCPVTCTNCIAARLPRNGHMSRDITCPLRKKYRRDTNQTGASSEEELDQNMVIDKPVPPTDVQSSQPTDDEEVVFQPARIDDSPRPAPSASLLAGAEAAALLAKWSGISLNDIRALPLDELKAIEGNNNHIAHMRALQLGTSISTVLESLNHV